MNDACIDQVGLLKLVRRAGKDRIEAAILLLSPECVINTGAVNFRQVGRRFRNGDPTPLVTCVQQLQDVVENAVEAESLGLSSPTMRETRQDKFVELLIGQFGRDPLSRLLFRHSGR